MIGKVPFSKEEKDLSTVPGVTENSKFGIIKNGILDTNESIEDSDNCKDYKYELDYEIRVQKLLNFQNSLLMFENKISKCYN